MAGEELYPSLITFQRALPTANTKEPDTRPALAFVPLDRLELVPVKEKNCPGSALGLGQGNPHTKASTKC